MTDVRTELRRTAGSIDVFDRPLERLIERRARRRRRDRAVTFTVAILVAALSVSGLVALLSGFRREPIQSGSDWEPTHPLSLGRGDYLYIHVTSSDLGDGYARDEETWWAADGSGEVRNRSTRQDKHPYPQTGDYEPGAFPTWQPGVSSLSNDPEVLAEQLRTSTYDWEALLLDTPYASPELRAAVFEVAAGLDGVTVIEDTRDPARRRAVALEWSQRENGDVSTWRAYFDPGTHQMIAWTFASSRGGSAWILLDSAIVEAAGAAPEPNEWLATPLAGGPS